MPPKAKAKDVEIHDVNGRDDVSTTEKEWHDLITKAAARSDEVQVPRLALAHLTSDMKARGINAPDDLIVPQKRSTKLALVRRELLDKFLTIAGPCLERSAEEISAALDGRNAYEMTSRFWRML